ncbi:winged helix-turn-helix transcriptional regulator [Amycolatopsis sp. lyj-346]|uniref:winged helix-turn-helix transcriptional regulator n=1 Tax=Amycolatopsis sp. lyj-346 TaxID=2789289 RepID=UPI003979CFAE
MKRYHCATELAADGLVRREEFDGRVPHVEYHLTEGGEELRPALTALYEWGERRATERGITFGPPDQSAPMWPSVR